MLENVLIGLNTYQSEESLINRSKFRLILKINKNSVDLINIQNYTVFIL